MLKKLLLSLALIMCADPLNAVIYYPENITAAQVASAPKKIKAWDIHKVLAAKEQSEFANILTVIKIAPRAMVSTVCNLIWAKITGRQNAASRAYDDIKILRKEVGSSGEGYLYLFEKHGMHEIAKAVEVASNNYKPQPGMLEIVKEITAAGIPQHFASNIGPRFLQNLKEKFNTLYKCDMLEHILPGKIVDYSKYGKKPSTIPAKHLASTFKPLDQFYQEFNATYNADKKEVVVFVDDSEANVKAAVKNGWVGIHYDVTKKNPEAIAQYRKDLIEVGILKQN